MTLARITNKWRAEIGLPVAPPDEVDLVINILVAMANSLSNLETRPPA